ncbi:MAG: hypothetical protein M3Y43_05335 [Pseudomonadota bacterium]|nr:hypothetical protein [Pseudomonadota bacterium]MDQ2704563.1 hypothetical protein [Pseudomonadota bacterium]
MKSVSTTIQIIALAACLAAQFHPATVTGMPGTRRALQTLEVFTGQPAGMPAIQMLAWAGR